MAFASCSRGLADAPCHRPSEDTVEQLAMGEIDGVTLLSPRTAQVYAALMRKQGLASVARGLVHFCLSPAVARRLEPLGTLRVQIADNPHLAEVLALIDAAAAQSES
jgi:uroporphyrinogen-III synthase